jgi:hypothetical protein
MGISYGRNYLRVTNSHVNQITNTNGVIVSQGDNSSGSFEFVWYPLNGGCGVTPNSQFFIELKDTISWKYITYQFKTTGTAACWNFNEAAGNLITFNSSVDRVFNSVNSFENPAYQVKMVACDNAETNFYRFAGIKSFYVTRRRSSLVTPASVYVDLSCNSVGVGSAITINNIFIWS